MLLDIIQPRITNSPTPPNTVPGPGTSSAVTKQKSKQSTKHKNKYPENKVHAVDYEGKPAYKEKENKKSSKSTKKKTASKAKAPANAPVSNVDEKAIPNPHPNPGYPLTVTSGSYTSTITIHSGGFPVTPSATHSPTLTSGFSPLPPLAAFPTSLALTSTVISPSSSATFPSATTLSGHQANTHAASKHLPTVIIVFLAVGAATLLVGGFIIFRMRARPRKHIPTPSLPVLQDPFNDDKEIDPEEESLFGGKERNSERRSNTVLLPWTQYPHASIIRPAPTLDVGAQRVGSPPRRTSPDMTQKNGYPFNGPGATARNGPPRIPNRVSAMSMSIYPGSPSSGHGVGVAISGSPLTADGLPVLQRSNSKPVARRTSKAGKYSRQSIMASDRLNVPNGLDDSELYTASPGTFTPKAGGRARVKAPYAPASLLRASNTLSGAPTHSASSLMDEPNPFEESQYVLPPISPMMKTEDRRERDTQALASALGLASPNPAPPSPQTTVYPDDSITLAGDRRRSRAYGHGRAPSHAMSPTTEASARLGKLMLGDLQSTASMSFAKPTVSITGPPSSSRAKPVTRKRVEDLPPRVPSPPRLPTLAQMALAHTNPDDFETYRSPTYSIYGLYEAERKSKVPGEGGY